MIRLSIPVRHALARLTLPVLIAATFGLMLLGKADAILAERARMALADVLAPIYGLLAPPLDGLRTGLDNLRHIVTLAQDNADLRDENERLRKWQSVALALDAENAALKAQLHWMPEPTPTFVTAPVVADAGGVYARAVLVSTGPNHSVVKGQVALDDRGLVGRVTEVGGRSVRILLITDLNSRIPVVLEGSRARAILTGTNGPQPRLMYWPEGSQPAEGERVVTSAEANVFPAGLPVGQVHYTASGAAEVVPLARLDRIEMVRLFNYGLRGLLPPEATVARPPDGAAAPRSPRVEPPVFTAPPPQATQVPGMFRGSR